MSKPATYVGDTAGQTVKTLYEARQPDQTKTGTCWGCQKHTETGLPGLIQDACLQCTAREIARSPAAHKRESDPSLIQAEMRKAWPIEAEYRKGRAAVWECINTPKGN